MLDPTLIQIAKWAATLLVAYLTGTSMISAEERGLWCGPGSLKAVVITLGMGVVVLAVLAFT